MYDLYLQDTLSEELEKALEKESVSFEESIYTSQNGRKVRTSLEEPQRLWMDFLAAGDPCYNQNLTLAKHNFSLRK